jgi:hypothetical protein
MQKKTTLEAISYKTRRVKVNGNWFSVDPFMNLDQLTVNKTYDTEFKTDNGVFYIDSFMETKVK